ncbi:hypothetical protein NK356_18965 [Chryseobacterium sp. S0630]|uniref:hypothetical protein n=1 Tax=Chryseobacterium sp. S0630 TaxID=2957803 RepID=UPI0020A09DC4|nr:hypothetical protein [Chryseobacterium sp. S0630]MCP1301264.1 hypothetical protein [Chryseobacterium sp. S0630]
MIRINNPNIEDIKNIYFDHLSQWFKLNLKHDKLEKEINNTNLLPRYREMVEYYKNNFQDIITSQFLSLENCDNKFKDVFRTEYDEYLAIINRKEKKKTSFGYFKWRMVEYYKQFFDNEVKNDQNYKKYSYGRWLTKILDIKVCPYCNHNYVFTVNHEYKSKIKDEKNNIFTRPQLDHFYSKRNHPLLSLSFYNLVPSCSVCNSIKRDNKITFSPYDITNRELYRISVFSKDGKKIDSKWVTEKNEIKIKINCVLDNKEIEHDENCNIEKLGLNKIYEEHVDYVGEIIDKVQAYNNDYYNALVDGFTGLGKTPQQIDTIIWNAYLDENERRPMSKLTTDILKQFKIK